MALKGVENGSGLERGGEIIRRGMGCEPNWVGGGRGILVEWAGIRQSSKGLGAFHFVF
jgi:hypothetical protein